MIDDPEMLKRMIDLDRRTAKLIRDMGDDEEHLLDRMEERAKKK